MSDEKAARLAAVRALNATKAAPTPGAAAAPPPPAVVGDAPAMALQSLLLILSAAVVGALGAALLLSALLPGLSASLLGAAPKAYWYLSRSSAFVAYGLLWLAMVFGLLITNKLSRLWPGGPAAFDLHQHASLLGLAVALFHGLILLGDRYIAASAAQVLIPFAYSGHAPLWVGLGQLALYLLALVGLSFYVRPWIGRRAWRLIHLLSFALFGLALLHGALSGSDSGRPWVKSLYWLTGGSVLFLLCYRLLAGRVRRDALQ